MACNVVDGVDGFMKSVAGVDVEAVRTGADVGPTEVLAAWKEAQKAGTMTEGPFLDPSTMFDDVFAEIPPSLESQRRYMLEIESGE